MYGATFVQATLWIANFETRLNAMLDEVEDKFPGGCEIFLGNIYDPTDGTGTATVVGLPSWPDGLRVLAAYNEVIERAAEARRNVHLIDLYSTFMGHGIACREKVERFRKVGRRWSFSIGKETPQQCTLSRGDTVDTPTLISGFRPHFVVADLPYGIQHRGELTSLLTNALPVWAAALPPSGAMVLAWESSRYPREEMISLVESASPLLVLNAPPYDSLAHRVDRAIKRRDVLVARPARSLRKGDARESET